MFQTSTYDKGFTFLEILIAVFLISMIFIILLVMGFSSINTSSAIKRQTQANLLAKEEFEAARMFRDGTAWATTGLGAVNFTRSNPYYFVSDNSVNPPAWSLLAGTETTSIFTRYVFFDKVSRNPSTKNIESIYNPANNDPNTIKITVVVSWLDKTFETAAFLTNWQNK